MVNKQLVKSKPVTNKNRMFMVEMCIIFTIANIYLTIITRNALLYITHSHELKYDPDVFDKKGKSIKVTVIRKKGLRFYFCFDNEILSKRGLRLSAVFIDKDLHK